MCLETLAARVDASPHSDTPDKPCSKVCISCNARLASLICGQQAQLLCHPKRRMNIQWYAECRPADWQARLMRTILRRAHGAAGAVRSMPVCVDVVLKHAVVPDLSMGGAVKVGYASAGLFAQALREGCIGERVVTEVAMEDINAGVPHAYHHVLSLRM